MMYSFSLQSANLTLAYMATLKSSRMSQCLCDSSSTTTTWLEANLPENSDTFKPLVKPSL